MNKIKVLYFLQLQKFGEIKWSYFFPSDRVNYPWSSLITQLKYPLIFLEKPLKLSCKFLGAPKIPSWIILTLPWNTFETSLKFPLNFQIPMKPNENSLETPFNLPWNTLETFLKYTWNFLDTVLKLLGNFLETQLKLPWHTF